MARDGTNRGGARPGAGRPRKALTEKIAEGKSAEVMMQPADIESAETPPVRDFMKEFPVGSTASRSSQNMGTFQNTPQRVRRSPLPM